MLRPLGGLPKIFGDFCYKMRINEVKKLQKPFMINDNIIEIPLIHLLFASAPTKPRMSVMRC